MENEKAAPQPVEAADQKPRDAEQGRHLRRGVGPELRMFWNNKISLGELSDITGKRKLIWNYHILAFENYHISLISKKASHLNPSPAETKSRTGMIPWIQNIQSTTSRDPTHLRLENPAVFPPFRSLDDVVLDFPIEH